MKNTESGGMEKGEKSKGQERRRYGGRGGKEERKREGKKKKHKSVSGISLCGCLTDPNKSVARQRASSGAMQGSWWH